MKVGSLVEAIEPDSGLRMTDSKNILLCDPVNLGELLVVAAIDLFPEDICPGRVCIRFKEKWSGFHPRVKALCGYMPEKFREIQPPMEIKIDELLKETV